MKEIVLFTWIICTAVSLLFLILLILWIFRTGKHQLGIAFWMLMLSGFFSYLPTYLEKYDFVNASICDIVNLMQIVTLNSNSYETYQPQIASPVLFYLCIFVRGCVHSPPPMWC